MVHESLAQWESSLTPLAQQFGQRHAALPPVRWVILPEVDSTNRWLLEHTPNNQMGYSLCIAYRQSAGRGRRGRSWLSQPGWSLTFSLGCWSAAGERVHPALPLVMGVAVARGLQAAGFAGFGLKWPNDILDLTGAKLGGILVETQGIGTRRAVLQVVGVGLNRGGAGALELDAQVTDLSQLPATRDLGLMSTAALLDSLLPALLQAWAQVREHGVAAVLQDYAQWDCLLGRPVRIVDSGQEGVACGIHPDTGALQLRDAQGRLCQVASGDVSLRLQP